MSDMPDHAHETIHLAHQELKVALEKVNDLTRDIELEPLHDDQAISEIFTLCKQLQANMRKLDAKMTDYTQE